MKTSLITQPENQFGKIILNKLDSKPTPEKVYFVSAFISLQTLLRLKKFLKCGSIFHFTIGIDLGGTSKEALSELYSWGVNVNIVKHRIPGHTFHPKIYLFEWKNRAEVFLGSSNLTEGGFFRNYECMSHTVYYLPDDKEEYLKAKADLSKFIEPKGPTAKSLDLKLIQILHERGEIPDEASSFSVYESKISSAKKDKIPPSPFGTEAFLSPPPIPKAILEGLMAEVRKNRSKKRKGILPEAGSININPTSFYMTLPTLQGSKIPGESRIPLEAIELAPDFWGWPVEYNKTESPRKGKERIYWNWKPNWHFWSTDKPSEKTTQAVRMYKYENSSDFRFYIRPLIDAGGNLGDIVKITRIAKKNAEFECVLAKKGSSEFKEWEKYCFQPVRNSVRKYGYA